MRCYGCGIYMRQQDRIFFSEVQTGHSVHYGRRGGGSSTYYAVKPFCNPCYNSMSVARQKKGMSVEDVVALVVMGCLIFLAGKCACG